MPPKAIIAVGGENLSDTVLTVSADGASRKTDNLGGSPYNVSVALARQGQTAHFVTPISTDDFGERLATHLHKEGVSATGARVSAPTTQAIVTLKEGVPSYTFHREETAERQVTQDSITAAIPDAAAHFHAGSLAFAGGHDADAWEAVFHAAAKRGLSTSLDPNVRPSLIADPSAYRLRFVRLLASAKIVKLSDEDLAWIYPDVDQDTAMTTLLTQTQARLVALTKGPDGAECWTRSLHCSNENPTLRGLVDTIGAGDTFMATLLAQLAGSNASDLDAAALNRIMRRALFAACLNCTKEGCDPPTTKAIEAALVRGTI